MNVKIQNNSLILTQGHSDFKIKSLFSQKLLDQLKLKFHIKVYRSIGMQFFTNEFGHIIKMTAMLINV